MSSDNPNPEQAQAKIATALGRLRGDVMPPITSQAAPRLSDQIGTAPLPMASTLRAEPTLAASNPAPGNPSLGSSNPLPANANPPFSAASPSSAPGLSPVTPPVGSLGNNASGTGYLGAPNSGTPTNGGKQAITQPDLLAGVDMGPPPLGSDYPRAEEDDGRRKRNRRLVLFAAAAAIVVIGGFWFMNRHHGDVPVITADTSPEKVKPTDQGGMQVPNQNVQVLENMNGQPKAQGGETVLPPPEQPVAPPAATDQAAAANPAAPATDGTQPQASQSVSTTAAPAAPSVPAPAVPAATANTAATTPAAPAVPAVPAVPTTTSSAMTSTPAVPAAPATTATAAAANSNATPSTTASAATTPQPAAKPAAPAAAPTAAPTGKLRIQLAAVKTEAAASATWAKLQKAHPAQLGNLSLMVEKVDKGAEGIFYRVQAGPFADKATAKSVCTALASAGQACILAH